MSLTPFHTIRLNQLNIYCEMITIVVCLTLSGKKSAALLSNILCRHLPEIANLVYSLCDFKLYQFIYNLERRKITNHGGNCWFPTIRLSNYLYNSYWCVSFSAHWFDPRRGHVGPYPHDWEYLVEFNKDVNVYWWLSELTLFGPVYVKFHDLRINSLRS